MKKLTNIEQTIINFLYNDNTSLVDSLFIANDELLKVKQLIYSVPNSEGSVLLMKIYKGIIYLNNSSYCKSGEKKLEQIKLLLNSKGVVFFISENIYNLGEKKEFKSNLDENQKLNCIANLLSDIDNHLNKCLYLIGTTPYSNMDGTTFITKERNEIYKINISNDLFNEKSFTDSDLVSRGSITTVAYFDKKTNTLIKSVSNHLTFGNYVWEELIKDTSINIKDRSNETTYKKFDSIYNEDSYGLNFVGNLELLKVESNFQIDFVNSRKLKENTTYLITIEGNKISDITFDGLNNLNRFNKETNKLEFYKKDNTLALEYQL